MKRWETIWGRSPLGMPRGCGPHASHTRSVAHLSCPPILTFKLNPAGRQQVWVLEPAIRQMTDAGDSALCLSGEQSQWHLQHTYWHSMTAHLEVVRYLPPDAKTSSMWNSVLSRSVQFFPRTPSHIPIILLTIQGCMRAEYDTEIGTAQICTVSTAQIVLNSTKPLTS